ncbi:MAG: squalene/phytoene synthase family protein [Verrucomicrobia bacterium]|nr:squalene/phytoene synthase family protein [Verrucomicrobiota bacterium]
MPLTPAAERELLTSLLKQVSRSFYLTLRTLPRAIRRQIGLAYLLARTTDTIADTEIIPVAQRLEALQRLRERILGTSNNALGFGELAKQQGLPAERVLLERVEESLKLLTTLPEQDVKLIREVLETITSGQELDLRRFDGASEKNIIALKNDSELDDYTYRVAGCVGLFWTNICRAHLFPDAQFHDETKWHHEALCFGKGLQLVNILRDAPKDLRHGRCYLPLDQLSKAGLSPADLLKPENEQRLRPVYNSYLDRAHAYLSAGWNYTNTIPRDQMRLRLACAWPVLIGLKTIKRLRTEPAFDPVKRVKASRAEVRGILLRSVLLYPFPRTWQRLGLHI